MEGGRKEGGNNPSKEGGATAAPASQPAGPVLTTPEVTQIQTVKEMLDVLSEMFTLLVKIQHVWSSSKSTTLNKMQ